MNIVPLLAAFELVRVHLVSTAPGTDVATAKPKFVKLGEEVTLVVAVEAKASATAPVKLYAPVAKVDLGDGKPKKAEPWPEGEAIEVAWMKVEATEQWVDNEKGGFHWETIDYAETGWTGSTGLSRAADVRATVFADRGGLGTMTFKVSVTAGGKTLATPGKEQVYRGGIGPKVHRVTVREDDTFLGYLTELYNTPYIWASAGSAGVHQADRHIGSDCADLMVYGMRRAGKNIDYGSTYDVPKWGGKKAIASIDRVGSDGRFVDAAGNPVKIGAGGVQRGDLVLFNRHVGAFSEDREPLGVLDQGDLLIHTAWAPPAEETFAESKTWTSPPFQVYRVPIP